MRVVFGLLTLFTSVLPPAAAQVPDNVNEMLRRIYASADFAPQRFGPARWIETGTAYTTVVKSDIESYDTSTGTRSIYVTGSQLPPVDSSEALDIDDYQYSAVRNFMLLCTNTQLALRQ